MNFKKNLILLLASFFEYLEEVPDRDLDQTRLDLNHFVAVFALASHEQFEFADLLFYDDASKPKLSKIKWLLACRTFSKVFTWSSISLACFPTEMASRNFLS